MEGCPSGLRSTPGERVYGKPYRGFKSHPFRCKFFFFRTAVQTVFQFRSNRVGFERRASADQGEEERATPSPSEARERKEDRPGRSFPPRRERRPNPTHSDANFSFSEPPFRRWLLISRQLVVCPPAGGDTKLRFNDKSKR